MATTAINHSNIEQNAWAFLSPDVMVRIDAMNAEEERQMRECMHGCRETYDIEGIQSVIAYHDRNGLTRRANIARAILAERLAEIEQLSFDIAFADQAQIDEIRRVEKRNAQAMTMGQLISLRDLWAQDGEIELHAQVIVMINRWAAVMLGE